MPIFAHSVLFAACAGVCQVEKTVAATRMDAGTQRKRRFDITVPTSRQLQEFAAVAPGLAAEIKMRRCRHANGLSTRDSASGTMGG
jgi:hypothetical protein